MYYLLEFQVTGISKSIESANILWTELENSIKKDR